MEARGYKLRALVAPNEEELGMGIEPLAAWRHHPQLAIVSLLKNWNEYEMP